MFFGVSGSVVFTSIYDRQMEMDEALGSLKEKFERERNLLTEENRKLTSETDRVGGNMFEYWASEVSEQI